MKFKIGDATDTAHCVALKHEFLRCDDAFKYFRHLLLRGPIGGHHDGAQLMAVDASV
jgi:hypothetical protein